MPVDPERLMKLKRNLARALAEGPAGDRFPPGEVAEMLAGIEAEVVRRLAPEVESLRGARNVARAKLGRVHATSAHYRKRYAEEVERRLVAERCLAEARGLLPHAVKVFDWIKEETTNCPVCDGAYESGEGWDHKAECLIDGFMKAVIAAQVTERHAAP